jgi:aquaporin Z
MNIRAMTGRGGLDQMKASFAKNWRHYLQEALGLAIFMVSCCLFSALLTANPSPLPILSHAVRMGLMGVSMGSTALFIFYSPWTAPSGSHINPAVTLAFLRLGAISAWDALFYVVFQFLGGTLAVYAMIVVMGDTLTGPPLYCVATVPGKYGVAAAALTEYAIAFLMMAMVLFTSANERSKKYTRVISACMVCIYAMLAGPISGFGMNPARSFASALPSGIWTAGWIYLFIPLAGMLSAAGIYQWTKRGQNKKHE